MFKLNFVMFVILKVKVKVVDILWFVVNWNIIKNYFFEVLLILLINKILINIMGLFRD